jgi:hypothetical protein
VCATCKVGKEVGVDRVKRNNLQLGLPRSITSLKTSEGYHFINFAHFYTYQKTNSNSNNSGTIKNQNTIPFL